MIKSLFVNIILGDVMKKTIKIFLILGLIVSFSGCASIVNKGIQRMHFASNPSAATLSIKDINGVSIGRYATPITIDLKRAKGYFKGQTYFVKVSKEGYKDINFQISHRISGWYVAGNLVFGGLLGWLVVDPLTGALYVLEARGENVTTSITNKGQTLTITLLQDLSAAQREQLKEIKISQN